VLVVASSCAMHASPSCAASRVVGASFLAPPLQDLPYARFFAQEEGRFGQQEVGAVQVWSGVR
jgi:hypothetical protein